MFSGFGASFIGTHGRTCRHTSTHRMHDLRYPSSRPRAGPGSCWRIGMVRIESVQVANVTIIGRPSPSPTKRERT